MATVVFVSHSHSDEVLAEALVELLLSALELEPSDVRCTSVPGHQLPFGKTIAEALKTDIETSAAVLVLLTEDSLRSTCVLFELGASWALGRIIIPILGHNQTPKVLPGPVSGYPCVAIDASDASSRMVDAISQIAVILGLRERSGGAREAKLRKFFDKAQAESEKKAKPELGQAMAYEIPWLIIVYISAANQANRII
jgi:TIR domain